MDSFENSFLLQLSSNSESDSLNRMPGGKEKRLRLRRVGFFVNWNSRNSSVTSSRGCSSFFPHPDPELGP